MILYQRLKDLREDQDKTQKEIAEIINTSANYYGDYEKGRRDIPTERMVMLADYYKVSMDYITGRTNDKGGIHSIDETEQELLNLYSKLTLRNKYELIGRIKEIIRMQEEKEIKNKEVG